MDGLDAQQAVSSQDGVPDVITNVLSFPAVAVPGVSLQESPLDGDLGECGSTESCVPEISMRVHRS